MHTTFRTELREHSQRSNARRRDGDAGKRLAQRRGRGRAHRVGALRREQRGNPGAGGGDTAYS